MMIRSILSVALVTLLAACSDSTDIAPAPPGPYVDDSLWLCKPGIADDLCLGLDQTITHVFEDGNTAVFQHELAENPDFDCFYVYPTVDLREEPGNTEDLNDVTPMLRPLYNQAARFTSLCRMYAPKYHQMTIGSYGVENLRESEFFQRAFADVEEAFDQYLLENPSRNFVLMGHSQGSHMLLELLDRRFENDSEMRSRLISALIIGPVGVLEVPPGELAGGSFQNLPLCAHATDTGCIIAYDSIAAGGIDQRNPPAQPWPCVNPTELGGDPGIAANTIYNDEEGIPFPTGVETKWIGYPGLYSARCEADGYLGLDVAPGRTTIFTPFIIQIALGGDDLHLADYNFAMGDLLRIVETQADVFQ